MRNIDLPANHVNKTTMILSLTPRQIEYIIAWKPDPFWPDEQRVLAKLRAALTAGEAPELSALQVRIILKWLEEGTGGHYGGGQVRNQEERAIMGKLDAALGRSPWLRRCAGHPRLPLSYRFD